MQNNSYKKWENKGWDLMQEALDKELPVEKKEKKRRFLFWYRAAGVALAVGVAVSVLLSNYSSEKASAEMAAFDEEKAVNLNERKTVSAKSEKIKSEASETFVAVDKKQVVKSLNKETEASREQNLNIETRGKAFVSVEKTIIDSPEKYTAVIFAEEKNDEPSEPLQELSPLEVLRKLPMRASFLDFSRGENLLPVTADLDLEPVEIIEKKKGKPVFGVSLGAMKMLETDAVGAAGGAFVHIPFGQSRFSLRSGINYRFAGQKEIHRAQGIFGSRDNDAFMREDVTVDNPDESTAWQKAEADGYYFDTALEQIQSRKRVGYHLLSIPLTCHYRLGNKWSLFFGAEGSVLLNFLDKAPVVNYQAETLGQDNSTTSSSFDLKKTDLAFTSGVEYQLNRRFRTHLKIHYGNLIKTGDWQLDHRFLEVGGSFFFGKKSER